MGRIVNAGGENGNTESSRGNNGMAENKNYPQRDSFGSGLLGVVALASDLAFERVHFLTQVTEVCRARAASQLPHTGDKDYHQYDPYHGNVPF